MHHLVPGQTLMAATFIIIKKSKHEIKPNNHILSMVEDMIWKQINVKGIYTSIHHCMIAHEDTFSLMLLDTLFQKKSISQQVLSLSFDYITEWQSISTGYHKEAIILLEKIRVAWVEKYEYKW